MEGADHVQLAFKREAGPQRLLDPRTMIARDDPNFESGRIWLYSAPETRGAG